MRASLGGAPNAIVLTQEALEALAPDSLDLIVANSVLQYCSHAECERLLELWRSKLKPGGLLALGDIIPKNVDAVADVRSLLSFAWAGGFLFAALAGLARTFLSDYRQLRARIGLTRYDERDMLSLLAAHDFEAARADRNLGFAQERMTFLAHKIVR